MTVSRSQPMMDELVTELRRHQAEYAELVHGPLCGQAADRIQALESELAGCRACREKVDCISRGEAMKKEVNDATR